MTIKNFFKLVTAQDLRGNRARLLSHYSIVVFMLIFIEFVSFAGCTKTPEAARKELSKLNVEYTPEQFLNSAEQGNAKVVKLFLQGGMNVNVKNADGQTALMLAASNGHIRTVKLLVKRGAYIDSKDNAGDTALSLATSKNYTDIVKLLKKAEIDKSY